MTSPEHDPVTALHIRMPACSRQVTTIAGLFSLHRALVSKFGHTNLRFKRTPGGTVSTTPSGACHFAQS
jgi:hypothetical protein